MSHQAARFPDTSVLAFVEKLWRLTLIDPARFQRPFRNSIQGLDPSILSHGMRGLLPEEQSAVVWPPYVCGKSTMDEIEAFLDECRDDPWFQSHPELVDRIETVLTKLYLDGEGPEWEAVWDQVCTVLKRTLDAPLDRCRALAAVLQGVIG